jgi:cell division protein FtsB
MINKIQSIFSHKRTKQLFDVRNIGLYIFGVVVLAIAWSGAKTVQNNYQLQKQISTLQQQNTINNQSKYTKNLEDWRDFLLGRKLFEN